ncbi:DNA polymerase delta subunit 3 isoform X1 [Oryzias latipes]|uniref:DNA polymerase delta subunit 3 n=1 Tax=Oryzias latipes TaxID=8090 RepID=H2LAH1_ORYLA|nr:DNA polymerase delta subunit 3 isoform X1 [Oryzias latipes]
MDELYLDNIDEFVNDHNKIVTYKSLSLTLGVHVNTAKQMLYHYLEHKRKESSPQLHATYLVTGKFVDNGQTCHKVSIVREDQLEDFKSKMSLIVSVHVYSVQKALLKDSGPLYSVDYDAVKDHLKNCSKYSAIQCSGAVPVSSLERQQALKAHNPPQSEPGNSGTNRETNPASKAHPRPPKGIMGMFSKKSAVKSQNTSEEVKPEQKDEPAVVDTAKNKPAAKANPMMNFFGSQTAKKSVKAVKEEADQTSSTSEPPPPPQRKSPQPCEKFDGAAVQTQKDPRSKTKRAEDEDSEEDKMDKKKRRRIKKPEPDSSDEEVVPDSPQPQETLTRERSPKKETETVQPSNGHSGAKVRKRRRVLKSRTYLDADGCMVTEKGFESESYSESEEDFQAPKAAQTAPFKAKPNPGSKEDDKKIQKKAPANSNKGGKQASIMGFFQKK